MITIIKRTAMAVGIMFLFIIGALMLLQAVFGSGV